MTGHPRRGETRAEYLARRKREYGPDYSGRRERKIETMRLYGMRQRGERMLRTIEAADSIYLSLNGVNL